MKNFFLLAIYLLITMNIISCRSTKNMKYFQDLKNEIQQGASVQAPEYLIKTDDNLYVDIKSMNIEVTQLFSPLRSSNNSGGTASEFGQVSSQYLNGYRVDQKGMILLPVIGEVNVVGMNEDMAKKSIQKRVDEYFKDATVKVKILTYKITVLGQVRNPGVYYNYDKSISILDAIGLASGTTDYASIKRVLVIRNTDTGKKSYRLDLTDKKTITSEAFYLLPNDVLYVEPDKYINNTLNDAKFALLLSALSTTILVLSYINK